MYMYVLLRLSGSPSGWGAGVPGSRHLQGYRMRCRLDFKISVGTCMSPMHEPVRMPHHSYKSESFFGFLFYALFAEILLLHGTCPPEEGKLPKIGNITNLFVTNSKKKKHRYFAHHRYRQLFHSAGSAVHEILASFVTFDSCTGLTIHIFVFLFRSTGELCTLCGRYSRCCRQP